MRRCEPHTMPMPAACRWKYSVNLRLHAPSRRAWPSSFFAGRDPWSSLVAFGPGTTLSARRLATAASNRSRHGLSRRNRDHSGRHPCRGSHRLRFVPRQADCWHSPSPGNRCVWSLRLPRFAVGPLLHLRGKEAEGYAQKSYEFFNRNRPLPKITLGPNNQTATLTVQLGPKAGSLTGTVIDAVTSASVSPCTEFRWAADPNTFLSGNGLAKANSTLIHPIPMCFGKFGWTAISRGTTQAPLTGRRLLPCA